jgi:hypothetical protein
MTMTTALIVSTAVAVSSAATSSTATVGSTTINSATAVSIATTAAVTTATVSSSASTIFSVIASISPAISPTRIATTFSSAATGTRGCSNGDAIGCDGSVPRGREDQHVRPAPAGNLEIIELGSAIPVRDSSGGSRQNTAAGGDRCRHGDAARSKVVTFGVLYLDCRLAAQLDASGS